MDSGLIVLLALAALVVYAVLAYVCVMKGKGLMALFAFFIVGGWVVMLVGAVRLAKPDSRWAVDHYDEEKMKRAQQRFATAAGIAEEDNAAITDAWADEDIDPDELDPITRRALRKAGRL
jgi:hypothetical protein